MAAIGGACELVTSFWDFKESMVKKKKLIEKFIEEKAEFKLRLDETKAFAGRIAVESYYQQLKEDKTRMQSWEAKFDVNMAFQAATALKDVHDGRKVQAELGEEYVEIKKENDVEITRLESGVAGGEFATSSIALTRQLMNDAIGMAQKDDWFQAVRLMEAAKKALANGTLIASNAEIIDNQVDDGKLINIAVDFDAAHGEFTKAHNIASNFDDENLFTTRLDAATTKADGARAQVVGDPVQARTTLEEAIKDCKEILTAVNDSTNYRSLAKTLDSLLKGLGKANKKKCVQPEIDAAKGFIDNAKALAKPPALDFKGAQAEQAKANHQIREGFGVTPYYKSYKKSIDGFEKFLKKLQKKKIAEALDKEAKRFTDLIETIKQAFTDRRMQVMEKRIAEAEQLKTAYASRINEYNYAVKRYESSITKQLGDEMNNAGTTKLAQKIRDAITAIDKAMDDHLYYSAIYMIVAVEDNITACKSQAKEHDGWLVIKNAANAAMDELNDRDEAENGTRNAKLAELKKEKM